ncbi:hypothetical protein CGCF413_v010395 [Colletotrichum fructicola]|nr:hypothetical protein CGCF413_v010395 [Colletotrichum fructicola]
MMMESLLMCCVCGEIANGEIDFSQAVATRRDQSGNQQLSSLDQTSLLVHDEWKLDGEIDFSQAVATRRDQSGNQQLSSLDQTSLRWVHWDRRLGHDEWKLDGEIDFSQAVATRRDQSGNQQLSFLGQISLVKIWLRECDEAHHACFNNTNHDLPTRLIDLNHWNDLKYLPTNVIQPISPSNYNGKSHIVRIVESSQLSQSEKSEAKYVALSHCWGRLGDQKLENAKYQFRGNNRTFPFENLPRTFQHAIYVTKMIGKRYLWIDSLCINQDHETDWETESARMCEVFKNAYCTIAATSARNSDEGFLNEPVTVPDPKSWREKFKADFQDAVENGVLNKRAWVLQERTLSRRIIHFTQKQLFLDCGRGVCWGPFGYLTNGKISFRSDANFPASLKNRSVATRIALFQSLFGDYSTYGLTKPTDRPTAIKSLVIAMAKVFDRLEGNEVEGGGVYYGIFGTRPYLHRSLLWHRIRDPLEHDLTLPSWSWMAYKGPIGYRDVMDVEERPEWDTSVALSGAPRKHDNEWSAKDEAEKEVGQLWLDKSNPKMWEELRCALIGREANAQRGNRKYYVLFVDEGNAPLKRLGVGWIYASAINFGEVKELSIA